MTENRNEAAEILTKTLKEQEGAIKNLKKIKSDSMYGKNGEGKKYAGIIGVGAAGGNVAHLLTGRDFDTAALNTTSADMSDINVDVKITIQGIDGSGKDRAFSANEFKRSYKNFFTHEKIAKLLENDTIFVIGSGGGGTGTIVSVMVAGYLKNEFPNKAIIMVGLLGSVREDMVSQKNMLEFMSDLEHRSGCPYMLFDNNRVRGRVGDDVYTVVNNEAANAIRLLSKKYFVENARSNIDGRDFARLISYTGLMSVITIDDLQLSVAEETIDLTSRVKAAIDQSTAIVTRDPEAYGIFMNTSQRVYSKIDTTFDDIQNTIGRPTSGLVFRHLQDSSDHGPEFGMILTGLESPVERFELIIQRIKEYERIKEKARIPEVDRSEGAQNLPWDRDDRSTGTGESFLKGF